MTLHTWTDTALWSELSKRNTPDALLVCAVLSTVMPNIEAVLLYGGTTPLQFTLHDSGHSFRVAERMSNILPSGVMSELSEYELTLLLMSAYLHDIGMTPRKQIVDMLYSSLTKGEIEAGQEAAVAEFRRWLDEYRPGTGFPLAFRDDPNEALLTANELVTQYSRSRHNDWSEAWIRENLTGIQLGTYTGWLDDLITLCKSHHEGYSELVGQKYNPRYVGTPAVMVQLRYLAALLRIADVLEIDPERTPRVILRHRSIPSSSLIYWWKDAEISIRQDSTSLSVYARPKSAAIHRAVEITVAQINDELLTCRKLADQTHFDVCPGSQARLPHRWELPSAVTDDIRPRDGLYVYIDGAFRPDTGKLLHLLSGVGLYGNEMVAIRELLQNSFDAVRERIAYERLQARTRGDSILESAIADLNHVELRIEFAPEGSWLICRDTGIGMNKKIIQDHLLVSGSGTRHDILELERICNTAGFNLDRTGQFGIGVLSYFMLADQVVLRTKRSSLPGDSEQSAWRFETEGIGSFGELRRDRDMVDGTEVKLRLRPSLFSKGIDLWYAKLVGYVESILIKVPCRFKLSTNLPVASLETSPGFTHTKKQFCITMLSRGPRPRYYSDPKDLPVEMLSVSKRQAKEADERKWGDVEAEFERNLRFDTVEGNLPDELGTYRLHLPYFSFDNGASIVFLRPVRVASKTKLLSVGSGFYYRPHAVGYNGWHGIRGWENRGQFESFQALHNSNCVVEINWSSSHAGKVRVSRHGFELSGKSKKVLDWLLQQCFGLEQQFLKNNAESDFNELNERFLAPVGRHERTWPLRWASIDTKAGMVWTTHKTPLANSLAFPYSEVQELDVVWKSKPLPIVHSLRDHDDTFSYQGVSWCPFGTSPSRIVARVSNKGYYPKFGLAPIWTGELTERSDEFAMGPSSLFPPEWRHIAGAYFRMYYADDKSAFIWNQENPIFSSVTRISRKWCLQTFHDSFDPLPVKASLLGDRSLGASWLLMCLKADQRDLWEGIRDRDPLFLNELWAVLQPVGRNEKSPRAVYFWSETTPESTLSVLSPTGWTVMSSRSPEVARLVPVPSREWRIEVSSKKYLAQRREFRRQVSAGRRAARKLSQSFRSVAE